MATKHLSNDPHHIRGREDAWWYEESSGVLVVVEPQTRTTQVLIPWRSIRTALARKDKPQDG